MNKTLTFINFSYRMLIKHMQCEKNSLDYFWQGCQLITQSGLRRYVIVPLLANIIIMSLLLTWFFHEINYLLQWGMEYTPTWLHWLGYIMSILIIIVIVILFCYFFSTLTNIIASPFNSLLAEKVEQRLTQQQISNITLVVILKDIPRMIKRELQKFIYYLVRATPLFLLQFIPAIGHTIIPIAWFIFTAWVINMQYADYAFDNHKISLKRTRAILYQNRHQSLGFGMIISVFTMIPLINLIIMPIAICGATAMWVDKYQYQVDQLELDFYD
jgi:CysZ protein